MYGQESAGSLLVRQLGADSVYAFFPHKPVMTNAGAVHGRLALGLFDSAFAAIGNRPVAFPLSKGPFGDEPYDAEPDNPSAIGSYADGYSAYLYLGPLEKEIFSPLIPGFYTEEHVREMDLHGLAVGLEKDKNALSALQLALASALEITATEQDAFAIVRDSQGLPSLE